MGVVGLWFGFGRKFQFVRVMGGNCGYRFRAVVGGGYWFVGFVGLWVCSWLFFLQRKKERRGKREMEEKRK